MKTKDFIKLVQKKRKKKWEESIEIDRQMDELMADLCNQGLVDGIEPDGAPRHQETITTCSECKNVIDIEKWADLDNICPDCNQPCIVLTYRV
jgi:RNase P subunit RPR2